MKTKLPALSFLLFILLLTVVADAGRLPDFIHAIYAFPQGDRVGHVVLYGVLAFLLARAFPRPFRSGRFQPPASIAVLLVLTTVDEWSQAFFTARTCDPIDLVCSCVGVFLGGWTARRWTTKERPAPVSDRPV